MYNNKYIFLIFQCSGISNYIWGGLLVLLSGSQSLVKCFNCSAKKKKKKLFDFLKIQSLKYVYFCFSIITHHVVLYIL